MPLIPSRGEKVSFDRRTLLMRRGKEEAICGTQRGAASSIPDPSARLTLEADSRGSQQLLPGLGSSIGARMSRRGWAPGGDDRAFLSRVHGTLVKVESIMPEVIAE